MNTEWIKKCQHWKNKWPVDEEQGLSLNDDSNGINLYKFIDILNQNLNEDSVIVWDAGSSLYVTNQALKLNGVGQRSIGSLAQAEMGAALGMSIGVSLAMGNGQVVCCIGDGSFNTNPQALAVIREHNLPITIFVLNNSGYLSIKNTQDKFFNGNRIGTSQRDGLFFPEVCELAEAYDLRHTYLYNVKLLKENIKYLVESTKDLGPIVCNVNCQELQEIAPGITAKKKEDGTLEQCDFSDMAPFLSKEERDKEMIG